MSILQEYETIRRQIGEEKFKKIEEYLELYPDKYLSDLYYKQAEWEAFEQWCNEHKEEK